MATFEHAVKKLPGLKAKTDGFVDLFWPGMLLVEQKSLGKNLDVALTQALSYFPGITERDLPQLVIVCDFARFRVHRLTTSETFEFALKDLHKHIKLFGAALWRVTRCKPSSRKTRSTSRPPSAWGACTTRSRPVATAAHPSHYPPISFEQPSVPNTNILI